MLRSAVDVREFARFVVTGLTATTANFSAVWLARHAAPYELALCAGIAAGFVVSFLLSKHFAFGSHAWDGGVGGEAGRFLIVYAAGSCVYWTVAVMVRRLAPAFGVAQGVAEVLGVLAGAGAMMVTTYTGHRFFTFRTHLAAAAAPSSEP